MVLLKLNETFLGSFVSFISTEQRRLRVDSYSVAETDDIELYNKDVKKRLLDNYGEKTEFCPSNRVMEKRDSQRGF